MKDPYLIKGQVCEVWNDENYWTYYFYEYDEFDNPAFLRFKITKTYEGLPALYFDNYRPYGTEWDRAPNNALDPKNKNACSTVDADGTIQIFWSNDGDLSLDKLKPKNDKWIHSGFANHITVGVCKDPDRVKNWKDSMRMRPAWAEVER